MGIIYGAAAILNWNTKVAMEPQRGTEHVGVDRFE